MTCKETYTTQETERSQVKANLIKSNLEKLKNDIKKDDNEIEKAYEIADVGEKNSTLMNKAKKDKD